MLLSTLLFQQSMDSFQILLDPKFYETWVSLITIASNQYIFVTCLSKVFITDLIKACPKIVLNCY